MKLRWPYGNITGLALLAACNADGKCDLAADPKYDPCLATSIRLSPSPVTLPVTGNVSLNAAVTLTTNKPTPIVIEECNTQGKVIVGWRSANPAVATVTPTEFQVALVVGVTADTTSIIATVGGRAAAANPADTIKVTVLPLIATVRLSAAGLSLTIGQTGRVTATVIDQNGRDITALSTVTWQSDTPAIATVDERTGQITPVAKGIATIVASASVAGVTASTPLIVTVADPPVRAIASLTIDGPATVRSGEAITLQATGRDADGQIVADPNLSWQSSAPTKATVARQSDAHKGTVSGLLVGKVTITATASSGKTATADVEVVPGPLARVVITPTDNTLRAGKTVQLTASATDARGNLIVGQAFTWSTSSSSLATVDNTGLVTTVNAGTPTIGATATGTTITGTTDVAILPRRVAYAIANDPVAASYTPNAATAFNSAGGTIAITRQGTGVYRVAFPGQQPLSGETETFMVSAYNASNSYCKIAAWGNGTGTNLVGDVRCFAFGGTPSDAMFSIALVSDDALGNRFTFALADQPTAPVPYFPSNSYNRTIGAPAPVRVARSAQGVYTVTFTGDAGPLDAEGIIVTAYGSGSERCGLASELTNESVLVTCWSGAPGSTPVDSRFTIAMSDRGRGFAERAGFAFVDDGVLRAQGGSMTLPPSSAITSTATPVRALYRGEGLFDVTFTGIATGPSGGRFVVLASAMVDGPYSSYCNVSRWTIVGADLLVTVTCWHEDGLPDDDAFYLFVIQ